MEANINAPIYIAGRISGQKRELCWAKFELIEERLRSLGYKEIYNPMKLGVALDSEHIATEKQKPDWKDYMQHDMIFLMAAETVVATEDWRTSEGATLELLIARKFGKRVINEDGSEFMTAFEIKKH